MITYPSSARRPSCVKSQKPRRDRALLQVSSLRAIIMRRHPVTIGRQSFETRSAADRFVEDLLYGLPLKVAIPEPHHSFLRALISKHPHAEEKIGEGIDHFTVEQSVRGGRCFCVNRVDGTKTDFSFSECVRGGNSTFDSTEAGMTTAHMPNCWICGRSVSLGDSQIDENGLAVHESCYVAKLALEKGQSQPSEAATVVPKKGQS